MIALIAVSRGNRAHFKCPRRCHLKPLHKPYKCSICGAEVPDLPMPVLQH